MKISCERLFDENEIYSCIREYAEQRHMEQTLRVLPYAKQLHQGQYRSGIEQVPYIYHPLMVACHALALGFENDNMIAAAILHDVCEDCNIHVEELPVNEKIKEVVFLLTHNADYYRSEVIKEQYFKKISENRMATIIKLLDRCNNVSSIASGFDDERRKRYIANTEKYFYPLMNKAQVMYPEYRCQLFLIEYHMKSVIESIKSIQ